MTKTQGLVESFRELMLGPALDEAVQLIKDDPDVLAAFESGLELSGMVGGYSLNGGGILGTREELMKFFVYACAFGTLTDRLIPGTGN